MEIKIEIVSADDNELAHFKVHRVTPTVEKIVRQLKNTDYFLLGKLEEEQHKILPDELLYVEVVDKKTFLYSQQAVYRNGKKLYQLEAELLPYHFIRVSKSMLLNAEVIVAVEPTFSGRFEATLQNKEKVMISRNYVPNLKQALRMGRER